VSETKEKNIAGKRVLIALGIICVVLAGGIITAIAVISSLNSQLSAAYVSVNQIMLNPSAWSNKIVVIDGEIDLFLPPGLSWPPYNCRLYSNESVIGVNVPGDPFLYKDSKNVLVLGFVMEGRWHMLGANGTTAQDQSSTT
jgi:hypothetical protein